MIVPNTKINKDEWFSFTTEQRQSKLVEVLTFLVAIDKGKLRIQKTEHAGGLGLVRKDLENFVESVIIWGVKTQPEK